jgi:hypothetical protein
MKNDSQCLGKRQLTARTKILLDQLDRLEPELDFELAMAKEHETAVLRFVLGLLLSGPSLTAHGWEYIDRQLQWRELWLDGIAISAGRLTGRIPDTKEYA